MTTGKRDSSVIPSTSADGGTAAQCGLIMPISAIDECSAEHWLEVAQIIREACETIGTPRFDVRLVSEADAVGVIHKRIVQNVYASDIVVCDMSGRNPNVMFELGMRLAFDKATVIIKDDKTPYSFDTGVIEHLEYPRSLRFAPILAFKQQLAEKVKNTYEASKATGYSTFLKNFGEFHTAKLNERAVPAEDIMLDALMQVQKDVLALRVDSERAQLIGKSASPVHSRAIPEIREAVRTAEDMYGPGFWRSSAGKLKLFEFLSARTECERYWGTAFAFRRAVEDVLHDLSGKIAKELDPEIIVHSRANPSPKRH